MSKKPDLGLTPLTLRTPGDARRASTPSGDFAEALFAPTRGASEDDDRRGAPAADAGSARALPAASPRTSSLGAGRAQADAPARRRPAPVQGPLLDPARLPIWAQSAYWVAGPLSLLWAGAMVAFAANFQNPLGPLQYLPFPFVAFAGLCLLPPVFIFLSAYAVRQAAKLSAETRRARALADDIAIPVALAADQAAGAAQAVRREVDRAAAAAAAAEQQLLGLRRALSTESDRLIEAADAAERRLEALTENLAREREGIFALTKTLDASVGSVTDSLTAQTRLVTEASDLAAAQVQEAEAALAARAADLAATAGAVGDAADLAGRRIAAEAEHLDAVANALAARVATVGDGLSAEREHLAALADRLGADQAYILSQIEAQRREVGSASAEARASVDELAALSAKGASALRALVGEVASQTAALTEAALRDKAGIAQDAEEKLKLFTDVVAQERAALEREARDALETLAVAGAQSRQALIEQARTAREQVEQLGEAAFAAAQKADHAFDTRMSEARRMIEQSAGLVEEAGQKSVAKVEAGLGAAQTSLRDLDGLLSTIDQKLAALPEEARVRAEVVRTAVEEGLEDLSSAARKAADEALAIDALFQDRIKKYDVLRDAMLAVGGSPGVGREAVKPAPVAVASALPARAPYQAAPAPEPPRRPAAERPLAPPLQRDAFTTPLAPTQDGGLAEDGPRELLGLRPRLSPAQPQGAAASSLLPPEREADRHAGFSAETRAGPTDAQNPADERLAPAPRVFAPAAPASTPAPAPARPPAATIAQTPAPTPAPTTAPPARDSGEWTWKDLLSSIDEPPLDDEVLAERLIGEIEALGLDLANLLPSGRIDEIAAATQAGDMAGARDAVRSLAPSAVRRLSRRVLTDQALRAHADRYIQRYIALLDDSARRDRHGLVTATLLESDPGRAFLLFNAAVGELS